jgi:hypothetical protein
MLADHPDGHSVTALPVMKPYATVMSLAMNTSSNTCSLGLVELLEVAARAP